MLVEGLLAPPIGAVPELATVDEPAELRESCWESWSSLEFYDFERKNQIFFKISKYSSWPMLKVLKLFLITNTGKLLYIGKITGLLRSDLQ